MGDAAFKTVTTGATVYVLGQAAKAIFVDPIMEQRKVIGEIAYNLMYLAPWYANPVVHDETPPEQRKPYDKAAGHPPAMCESARSDDGSDRLVRLLGIDNVGLIRCTE